MQLDDIPTAQPVETHRDHLFFVAQRLTQVMSGSYDEEILSQEARRLERELLPYSELWQTPGLTR